jgi:pentatricopeptide repeat protein
MASVIKSGTKYLSRKARIARGKVEPRRIDKETIAIVRPNMQVKQPPLSPKVKEQIENSLQIREISPWELRRPGEMLGHLDSTLEVFFQTRPYTIENFNLLLKVQAQHGKVNEAMNTLDKMHIMDINPNLQSYTGVMSAAARANLPAVSEKMFDIAARSYGKVGSIFTSLVASYVGSGNYEMIEKIMREKSERGLEIVPADITSYINSLSRAKLHLRALEVYKEWCNKIVPDEYMMIMGIHAAGKCYEAEYGLKIWNLLNSKGFVKTAYPYNEIIMTLGKRKDYADRAIDIWREMRNIGITPDSRSYTAALTAVSRLGDLHLAREVLYDMKQFDLETDTAQTSLVLHIYANACKKASESEIDQYIKESWEIFSGWEKKGGVVTDIVLNSLLSVHTMSLREHEAEAMVLPLFESYGLKRTLHTYRHLISMFKDLKKQDTVKHLYSMMRSENIEPDVYILNYYLETRMRAGDTDEVYNTLVKFKESGLQPLFKLQHKLYRLKDCPERILAALQEFDNILRLELAKTAGKKYSAKKLEKLKESSN